MRFLNYYIMGIAAITFMVFPLQVNSAVNLNDAGSFLTQAADSKRTGLSQEDLSTSSGKLIQRVLAGVGIIFLVLMIYAGILWMTAHGNDDQVHQARNTIIAALIGVVLVVGAYAVTSLILQRLVSGADGSATSNQVEGGVPGCCLDRVDAGWACRVTTIQDCVTRGLVCEAGDSFCTAADYEFDNSVTDVAGCVQKCENR